MRDTCKHVLESYHYIHGEGPARKMRKEGLKIFLDSGAFSAYTQGVSIDIGKFCDYCHRNSDFLEVVSVLDVIDFNDKKKSIKGTYQNLMEMKRRGIDALPCFHYGEPEEVLQHYAEHYDHITIGGMVPISTPQLMLWLDRLWDRYLTNPDGSPKLKVHGFGLTSLPLMMRYPWYSVDSSTWVQWAANGLILVPTKPWGSVSISEKSSHKKIRGMHIDSVTPVQTAAIEAEIRSLRGDPDRLRVSHYSRSAWNAWAFSEYARIHDVEHKAFKAECGGLF